jgi:hypothetical protein
MRLQEVVPPLTDPVQRVFFSRMEAPMTGPFRMSGNTPEEGDPVLVPGDPAIPPAPEVDPAEEEQVEGEDPDDDETE